MSKRGKIISGETRQIIYNVIKCFNREKSMEQLCHPIQKATLRAAAATGVSVNMITKIKKEGQEAEKCNSKIQTPTTGKRGRFNNRAAVNAIDLGSIRRIIGHIYYVKKEIPTIRTIHTMAKKEIGFKGCRTTMLRILKHKLRYHFKRCAQNKSVLIENNDIKTWRIKYLSRMRINDALGPDKKPVIYLDELLIDTMRLDGQKYVGDCTNISLKNDKTEQKWIIINAGYEEGFVKNAGLLIKVKNKKEDSYDELGSDDFYKYVREKLIPNLPNNCIVAIDDAPYHNIEADKSPSYYHSKEKIQDWMTEHAIPYDAAWTKPELLVNFKKSAPEKVYVIDKLLQEHGHEVVRIPPYCNLNPIEYVWEALKDRLSELKAELPDTRIEILVTQAMSLITKEDWVMRINHVKENEKEFWKRDVVMENDFESLIMKEGMLSDSDEDNLSDVSMDKGDKSDDDDSEDDNTAGKYMLTIAPMTIAGGSSVKKEKF